MKQIYALPVTVLSLGAAAAMLGCGGGGGGASGGVADPLASGRAALNNLASGTQSTTTQSLTNALALFQQALKADPGSAIAHFGEAVALGGVCTDMMDNGTTTVTSAGGFTGSGTGGGGGISGGTPPPPPTKSTQGASLTRSGGGSGPGTGIYVGPNIPAPPSGGTYPPCPPTITGAPQPVQPDNTLGLFWFLDRGLSNPYTLLRTLGPVTDLHLGLIPFSGYASDSSDVARRQTLLADLATILSDLAVVEADPTFTYSLPAPDQSGQTVTIGLPEVYLFDAYINSLQAQIALSLAYVRDPGNYQTVSPVIAAGSGGATGTNSLPPAPPAFVNLPNITGPITLSYTQLDANHDGKLEPNEYLPPSPFLTLRSASYLATVQKSLAASASKETLGINGVLARKSGSVYLIPNTPQIAAILTNIETNVVPLIAQAAVGPVTLTFPHYTVVNYVGAIAEGGDGAGGVFQSIPSIAATIDTPPAPPNTGGSISGVTVTTEKVTINLVAWFNNPPPDLKAFAPTYTLTAQGGIDPNGTVYPDPTFGGLFPNGLPNDLLL